jgi:hypothetical protein
MVMLNIQLKRCDEHASIRRGLTIKLIEQLRENESGVYGVSARGIMNKIQTDRTVLTLVSLADRTMQRN